MDFNAIVVEADASSRNRLKQATLAVTEFKKTEFVSTTGEALDLLTQRASVDVIFISSRIEQGGIANFVKAAKEKIAGQDAAYVLIADRGSLDASSMTEKILVGADGILCEPYSVDSLVEMTRLAARVRKERREAREEAMLRYLVVEIGAQLDNVARLKKAGCEAGISMRALREMCSTLGDLSPASRERYNSILTDHMEKCTPPPPLPRHLVYRGISKRVQTKVQERLIKEATEQRQKIAS